MWPRSSSPSSPRPASRAGRLLLALALLAGAGARAEITAAVAANMQFAFEEIRKDFAKETGIEVKPVYGASGKLQSQIRAGAPFDLFVSADVDWVDTLVKGKHAVGRPEIYAYGKLLLWTTSDIPVEKGVSCLLDPAVRKVAVGDLKLTIYGPAAWRVLEKAGILDHVKPKVVYGANIGQVAQYVSTGATQVGFVGKGQIAAGPLAGKGKWFEIPEEETGKMPQSMAMTRYGAENNPKSVRRLMDHLLSAKSRQVLTKYGYGLP